MKLSDSRVGHWAQGLHMQISTPVSQPTLNIPTNSPISYELHGDMTSPLNRKNTNRRVSKCGTAGGAVPLINWLVSLRASSTDAQLMKDRQLLGRAIVC